MGAIVERLAIKSERKQRRAKIFFDSDSPHSFIRKDIAESLGRTFQMGIPLRFNALGNGSFVCREAFHLLINIKGIWCPHFFYVALAKDLDEEILIGQDFMQLYKVKLDLEKEKLVVDLKDLKRTQKIYISKLATKQHEISQKVIKVNHGLTQIKYPPP